MATVSVPKKEYERLKQFYAAYLKIVEEITKAERAYPYDYRYLDLLTKQALRAHKRGETIEAESVNGALAKFKFQKRLKR